MISNLLSIHSLHDIWREKNISKKEFTWRDKAYKVQCRLDYFLTTPNLTKLTRNCDIIHAPGSDHCAVKLFIQSEALNKKPGPGFWKFNCSLLENEAYINELKEKRLTCDLAATYLRISCDLLATCLQLTCNCGRLVIFDSKINGSNLILVNVYAPNEIA